MKAEIDHIAVTMLLDIDNVQLESGLIYTHSVMMVTSLSKV